MVIWLSQIYDELDINCICLVRNVDLLVPELLKHAFKLWIDRFTTFADSFALYVPRESIVQRLVELFKLLLYVYHRIRARL